MGTMTAFSPIKKKRKLSPQMVLILAIGLALALYGLIFIAGLVT